MKKKRHVFLSLMLVCILFFFSLNCYASTDEQAESQPAEDGQSELIRTSGVPIDFIGLGFGTGVSLTWDTGGAKDRVKSANVVNGIVRIENEDNTQARIMLEIHYLFITRYSFIRSVSKENWGHGPFVALQPGTDEIIESIGLGWMIAFKKPSENGSSKNSFNLGIGFVVDPNVQVLGDGIEPNQPLPTGETEIRYKEETEAGILFLASFQF